jgi:hypothetical protein
MLEPLGRAVESGAGRSANCSPELDPLPLPGTLRRCLVAFDRSTSSMSTLMVPMFASVDALFSHQ